MWFPTQCWEKQGRHELPWMLFALYPYSPVHTCIPWVNPSWFSCCAQGGEGRGGEGRRALGDPGAQPGTTGFQNNSRHSSIPCATTLPPQSRAFFLSRNWFVPCGLVAFLFGFWGGGGKCT